MFRSSYEGSQLNIASCVTYPGSTHHRLNETLKKTFVQRKQSEKIQPNLEELSKFNSVSLTTGCGSLHLNINKRFVCTCKKLIPHFILNIILYLKESIYLQTNI